MSEKPISPLRARMIEDMTVRNFAEMTKNDYIRHVKTIAIFLGCSPHLATPEDLRFLASASRLERGQKVIGSPDVDDLCRSSRVSAIWPRAPVN